MSFENTGQGSCAVFADAFYHCDNAFLVFLPFLAAFISDLHRASVDHFSYRKSNSAPYKRPTYFHERISQWRMQEPEIIQGHWELIAQGYNKLIKHEYGEYPIVSKEQISEILRYIDTHLIQKKVLSRLRM